MNHRKVSKIFMLITVISLLAVVLASFPTESVSAHGKACYSGTAFYKLYAGGSWHWYAFIPKPSTATNDVTAWHAHGVWPWGGQLWPDSVSTNYVKVFFRWPDNGNPYIRMSPSQFQACLN